MATLEDRLDPQVLAEINANQSAYLEFAMRLPDSRLTYEDRTIPGPDNAPDVRVHVYRPVDRGNTPTPALLWIQGGGFMQHDLPSFLSIIESIVLETGTVVIAPEYRLAPAHPFPAALNDCYAVLQWLASASDEYHIDRDNITIAGVSAGGCLAAAITLMTRDKGGPALCYQILLIPVTDDRLITASSQSVTDPRVFNSAGLRACWKAYLGENDGEVSPYAAPARATNLSRLPPAYVFVEDQDPLRDEGIAYANRLMQAGVNTELHAFPGTYHGSFLHAPNADVSKRAVAECQAAFKRALNPE